MADTNDALRALISQKAALDQRKDLTADEKQKLAKQLRRQIRKLRGQPDADPTLSPARSTPTASGEPKAPRKKRERDQVRYPERRSWKAHLDTFRDYRNKLLIDLESRGLQPRSLTDCRDLLTQGYDIIGSFEADATLDDLFEKFKTRWANHEPQWFTTSGKEGFEILLLGPLPSGMTN